MSQNWKIMVPYSCLFYFGSHTSSCDWDSTGQRTSPLLLQRTNLQVSRVSLDRWAPQGWLRKGTRGSKYSHVTFPCPSSPEMCLLTSLVRTNRTSSCDLWALSLVNMFHSWFCTFLQHVFGIQLSKLPVIHLLPYSWNFCCCCFLSNFPCLGKFIT